MTRKDESAIIRLVVATGISSVVTQLLTIREFLALFQGNEFVIAIILFNWLILGGIGTFMARWFAPSLNRLVNLSIVLAGLPGVQFLLVRALRDVFFVHGASVGFYPTFAYTFISITPYALLLGFVLPYALFTLRLDDRNYPGARIYMADNLGDVAGGCLFSFLLVYLVSPLTAICLASVPMLVVALGIDTGKRRRLLTAFFCLLSFAVLISGVVLEKKTLAPRQGELVHYQESPYGRIEVQKAFEQYTVFVDGAPLFSSQNVAAAEESVHYALSQVDKPQHVLLISAQSGMMRELNKYNLASVDYLELDPAMSEVQFKYGFLQKIDGLSVINMDGRKFLQESDKKYDAILLSLPEPATYQVNRFFTGRFFELARQRLAENGVLSFNMQGFDNYLAEPQRQKISSLFNTVKNHFKNVLLLPGQAIFFLCADQDIHIDIPARLDEKNIQTRFISNYYSGDLTRERIKLLNDLIDPAAPENRDYAPQLMQIMFSQWFHKFSTSPKWYIWGVSLLLFGYLCKIKRHEFVLFSTGFMTMGSEILVIFAFQIFYGYIYLHIGLIVTVFLAGLLPGAWLGEKYKVKAAKLLGGLDLFLIAMMALFILIVVNEPDELPMGVFLIYGLLLSVVCGCQFPLTLAMISRKADENKAATRSFSADLIGAACGTLFTSVVFLPFLGIIWTTVSLMALKTISLLIAGTAQYAKN